jgi:excisionase family DNA binding protein
MAIRAERPDRVLKRSAMTFHGIEPSKGADALLVKPRAACQLLNCGRTRLYELMKQGELQSFRDGRSRKVVVQSIFDYIDRQLAASVGTTRPDQAEAGIAEASTLAVAGPTLRVDKISSGRQQ